MKDEKNKSEEAKQETLEGDVAAAEKVIGKDKAPMSPGIYIATEASLGDKLRKIYFSIKRDLPSDNDNLRHAFDSIRTSLDLGPGYYDAAALILKSAHGQVKIEAVRAKISEMYSLITGSQIEKQN